MRFADRVRRAASNTARNGDVARPRNPETLKPSRREWIAPKVCVCVLLLKCAYSVRVYRFRPFRFFSRKALARHSKERERGSSGGVMERSAIASHVARAPPPSRPRAYAPAARRGGNARRVALAPPLRAAPPRRGWGETDSRFERLDRRARDDEDDDARGRGSHRDDDYGDTERNINFQELRKRQDRENRTKVRVVRAFGTASTIRSSLARLLAHRRRCDSFALAHRPPPGPSSSPSSIAEPRPLRRRVERRRRARWVVVVHGRGQEREDERAEEG